MATLTITIPDKDQELLEQFVNKLGGEVIATDGKKHYAAQTVISKVEEGLVEMQSIREGKSKGLTLNDVLGE